MNIYMITASTLSLAIVAACSGANEAPPDAQVPATSDTADSTVGATDPAPVDPMDTTTDDGTNGRDDVGDPVSTAERNVELRVRVGNVTVGEGTVLGVLQTKDQFADLDGTFTATAPADAETVELVFFDVDPGTYAAAVFQDLNDDGGTTVGEAGPTEPWGFSGDPQSGAPSFAPAAIDVGGEDLDVTITLKN